MPKRSRARTRAVRARMAETGQNYTQAAVSLSVPQMNRDLPPAGAMVALMFAELMAAGRRAAIAASEDLAEATAAVQAALTPLWPHVVPEAARDVLVTCAQIAVGRGVTELPAGLSSVTAAAVLELTAEWVAAGSPDPPAGLRRPSPTLARRLSTVMRMPRRSRRWRCCSPSPTRPRLPATPAKTKTSTTIAIARNAERIVTMATRAAVTTDPDPAVVAARGLAVFPLPPGGRDAPRGWHSRCTADLAELARRWPASANIGVGCRANLEIERLASQLDEGARLPSEAEARIQAGTRMLHVLAALTRLWEAREPRLGETAADLLRACAAQLREAVAGAYAPMRSEVLGSGREAGGDV